MSLDDKDFISITRKKSLTKRNIKRESSDSPTQRSYSTVLLDNPTRASSDRDNKKGADEKCSAGSPTSSFYLGDFNLISRRSKARMEKFVKRAWAACNIIREDTIDSREWVFSTKIHLFMLVVRVDCGEEAALEICFFGWGFSIASNVTKYGNLVRKIST